MNEVKLNINDRNSLKKAVYDEVMKLYYKWIESADPNDEEKYQALRDIYNKISADSFTASKSQIRHLIQMVNRKLRHLEKEEKEYNPKYITWAQMSKVQDDFKYAKQDMNDVRCALKRVIES